MPSQLQEERVASGLCQRCGKPREKYARLCNDHQAELYAMQTRWRRKKAAGEKVAKRKPPKCSLCLGVGHSYTTCPINADWIRKQEEVFHAKEDRHDD